MTTHWLDHLSRSLTHDHDGSKHSLCNSVVLVNPRKTTVKATNICPLKRSNTYNPYSPLKRSLCHNCATMGYRTKMDKATGPSKGRVNSSICKGLTHLRHCGTAARRGLSLSLCINHWDSGPFSPMFFSDIFGVYIYIFIHIYNMIIHMYIYIQYIS